MEIITTNKQDIYLIFRIIESCEELEKQIKRDVQNKELKLEYKSFKKIISNFVYSNLAREISTKYRSFSWYNSCDIIDVILLHYKYIKISSKEYSKKINILLCKINPFEILFCEKHLTNFESFVCSLNKKQLSTFAEIFECIQQFDNLLPYSKKNLINIIVDPNLYILTYTEKENLKEYLRLNFKNNLTVIKLKRIVMKKDF